MTYKYDELTDKAKERARDWYRSTWDSIDNERVTEAMEYTLEKYGYVDLDINWSLSYCQGDGVAFYGKLHETNLRTIIERLLKEDQTHKKLWYKQIRNWDVDWDVSIYRIGRHYNHYNTMGISLEFRIYAVGSKEPSGIHIKKMETFADWLEEALLADVKDISRKLEIQGYEEIEYLTSDETVEDDIRANEYDFNQDGTIFRGD